MSRSSHNDDYRTMESTFEHGAIMRDWRFISTIFPSAMMAADGGPLLGEWMSAMASAPPRGPRYLTVFPSLFPVIAADPVDNEKKYKKFRMLDLWWGPVLFSFWICDSYIFLLTWSMYRFWYVDDFVIMGFSFYNPLARRVSSVLFFLLGESHQCQFSHPALMILPHLCQISGAGSKSNTVGSFGTGTNVLFHTSDMLCAMASLRGRRKFLTRMYVILVSSFHGWYRKNRMPMSSMCVWPP